MRAVRIIALSVAALVALLVIAGVALLLFINPDDYRHDIERIVQQRTGRQLTLGGKLELKLFPWLALSVRDVSLGNPPGFGSQPFVTVQNASLGVKLLPLLGKRLEVSRLAVEGLSVNLITRGEKNNWEDLTASKSSARQANESSSASGSASIAGVDVRNSVLTLRDESKHGLTQLSGLEIHTGPMQSSDSRVSVEKLQIGGGWVSQGSTKPLSFALSIPEAALDRQTQTLAPATLDAKLGALAVRISIAGEKLSSDRVVSGVITVARVSARQVLQALQITPPITRDPAALSAFAMQANYRLTKKQLSLSSLDLTLDDTHVKGSAGSDDLDKTALSFDLTVDALNADRYRRPVQKVKPAAGVGHPAAGAAASSGPATPLPLESLRKLDAHGTLHVGKLTFAALQFTDVVVPVSAQDGLIKVSPTHAGLFGGTCDGDVVLDARPVQAQLSLNERVHATDMAALAKAALDSSRISGRADANVALTAVGTTDEAMMRSLSGKIDANVTHGALEGIDIGYELQRATALFKREALPARSGPARTPFNSLQASGTIEKGVLHNSDLHIETDYLKVRGGGTLDLLTEALDYQLVAALYQSQAGKGGAASASIEIPLLVTGTAASPVVRPDLEALAKGQLRQQVNEKVQQQGDQLKKKLGDKLKDWLSH